MLSALWNWMSRLLAIAGLVGIVFFFPVVICHQHTSLFEHLTTECQRNVVSGDSTIAELLRHYLFPYGILWWLSIALATSTITYQMRRRALADFEKRVSPLIKV